MAKMAKLVSTSFATDEATKMLKVNDTGSRPELRTASALQVRVALYAALCLFTAWAAPEYTSLNWMHPRSSCVQLLQYERPGAGVVSIVVSSSSTPKEHMLSYDLGLCGVMMVQISSRTPPTTSILTSAGSPHAICCRTMSTSLTKKPSSVTLC